MSTPPLRRRLILAAALAASFVAGGLVVTSVAARAADMAGAHAGMGHGDMHAMMGAHIEEMLAAVDATPDQRQRIHAILGGAMRSMAPLHEEMKGAHGELHRLLTAPVIDRAALERLRAARIADVDQASRALVNAMADAAEVLSPEQRAKLGAMMVQRHHP
ncbi:MAG TPA: Spy/CpxP family protein refolding chaperone [Caulobacteraceae bacterium]|jgi:Spy/CpxP family protein refolding chaperone